MVCQLDRTFEDPKLLRFERVERSDFRRYLDLTVDFMSGSPDNVLNMILNNLLGLPDDFLDFVYKFDHYYFVYDDGEIVGILDIEPKRGTISNIGVDPQQRGKGYGRQIMHFVLNRLREEGREKAGLRIHVDNEPAISLYESLGFSVTKQHRHLIWRKQ